MSAISGYSSGIASTAPSAYESLTSGDFIRVMFAELSRQDPTKPTDSKDLLAQLGSIRGIESDLALTKRLQDIARQNEITSAGSLVGQFVEGVTDSGIETRGFVDSVSITRLGVVLNLSSGYSVALGRLSKVHDPALIGIAPPAGTPADETSGNPGGVAAPPAGDDETDDPSDPAEDEARGIQG